MTQVVSLSLPFERVRVQLKIKASNGSQCTLRAKSIFNETLTIGNASKIKHVVTLLTENVNGFRY